MLESTFLHIPRISATTEQKLWRAGATDWHRFLRMDGELPLTHSRKDTITSSVKESMRALHDKDGAYFARRLPVQYHWRAYRPFREKACFLDIETTGLTKGCDIVTVVGIATHDEVRTFVHGRNMDDMVPYLRQFDVVVTFNGRCFDIPFLQRAIPGMPENLLHVDLRFVLRSLGYSGGLKLIERQMGIARDDEIADVDGFEAVRLWYRYRRGDSGALGTLLAYNIADVENLRVLMDIALARLLQSVPFPDRSAA